MSVDSVSDNDEKSELNNFEGLGKRYLKLLEEKAEHIYQVDLTTGFTESNGSVRTRAILLANGLRNKGLKPKDIVGVCSRCHCDQTITVLASLLIGAIVSPIYTDLPHQEYINRLKSVKPKMIFCDVRVLGIIEKSITETKLICDVFVFDKGHATKTVFNKLLTQSSEPFKAHSVPDPKSTVAFILPTQGTGGDPQLICISHYSILYQTFHFLNFIEMPNAILSYFPLSWILEPILMCSCIEFPVTRILPTEATPRNTCKLIHDMRVDYVFLPTSYARKLIKDVAVKDYNLSSLKCVFVGSVRTATQDMNILRQTLPKVKFSQFYASTEAGSISLTPFKDYFLSLDHPNTAGKLIPGVKIKIVDLQTGSTLGANLMGEILIHSEALMLGYYRDPKKTSEVRHKHYLRTGDIGQFDTEGWLYVYGRKDDLVNYNGISQCPSDLEDLITSHPFVEDCVVLESNNQLIACIVAVKGTTLDANNMMKYLKERTEDQLPTKFVFFPEFPKTPIGNVRRGNLKSRLTKVVLVHKRSISSIS